MQPDLRIEVLGPDVRLILGGVPIALSERHWLPLAVVAIWQGWEGKTKILLKDLNQEAGASDPGDRNPEKYLGQIRKNHQKVFRATPHFPCLQPFSLDFVEFIAPTQINAGETAGLLAAQRLAKLEDFDFMALRSCANVSKVCAKAYAAAREARDRLVRVALDALDTLEFKDAWAESSLDSLRLRVSTAKPSSADFRQLAQALWASVYDRRMKSLSLESLVGAVERIDRRLAIDRGLKLAELQPDIATLHLANCARMAWIQGDKQLVDKLLSKVEESADWQLDPITEICYQLASAGALIAKGPELDDLPSILEHLAKAKKVAVQEGEVHWLIECYWTEATACWRAHKGKEDSWILRARSEAELGLALATEHGDSWWISRLHDRLLTIHFRYEPQLALAHLRAAEEEGFGSPVDLLALARFKINGGWTLCEPENGTPDRKKGVAMMEQGLSYARVVNVKPWIIDALSNLTLIHLDMVTEGSQVEGVQEAKATLGELTELTIETGGLRDIAKTFELWGCYWYVLEARENSALALYCAQACRNQLLEPMDKHYLDVLTRQEARLPSDKVLILRSEATRIVGAGQLLDQLRAWSNFLNTNN